MNFEFSGKILFWMGPAPWFFVTVPLQATKNQLEALDSLQKALALAQPEGYVRIFLDEGESMYSLIASYQK